MKKLFPHLKEAAKDMYKLTDNEFEERIENHLERINKSWEDFDDLEKFYEKTPHYVFNLIQFNDPYRVQTMLYPVSGLTDAKVLDFGAGIGELGMQLARWNNVHYYDVNKDCKKFAKLVSKSTGRPLTFLEDESEVEETGPYDLIVIADVLEHLKKPMDTVYKLHDLLKPGGFILTTGLDFSVNEKHPMHLEENKEYVGEHQKFYMDNYTLKFFHQTMNENIYLWRKKENEESQVQESE